MTELVEKTAPPLIRLLARAGDVLLAIVVTGLILRIAGEPWNHAMPAAFVPMVGTVNCDHLMQALVFLTPLVVGGSCIVRARDTQTTFLLGCFAFFAALVALGEYWLLLNKVPPTQRIERIVTIRSVTVNSLDQDPDCRFAYNFDDSVGNEQYVCTDAAHAFKAGTQARILERKNYFGVAILQFAPIIAPATDVAPGR